MKRLLLGISTLLVLLSSGCSQKAEPLNVPLPCLNKADQSKKLSAACVRKGNMYIFPAENEKLTCKQIKEEIVIVNQRVSYLSYKSVADVIGGILFIGLISGGMYGPDLSEDSELRLRKIEYETLRNLAIKKNCSFAVEMR